MTHPPNELSNHAVPRVVVLAFLSVFRIVDRLDDVVEADEIGDHFGQVGAVAFVAVVAG